MADDNEKITPAGIVNKYLLEGYDGTKSYKSRYGEMIGYSIHLKTFAQYSDKECVVAYRTCYMGALMIIKGKVGFFCFTFLKSGMSRYNIAEPTLSRIEPKDFIKIFDYTGEGEKVIVDEDGFNKFKRTILYGGIVNDY